MDCRLDGIRIEVDSQQGQRIFLFSTESRLTLGPSSILYREYLGPFSPVVIRQEHDADHWPSSSSEVKNGRAIPLLLHLAL
jgi:hypothetical protein